MDSNKQIEKVKSIVLESYGGYDKIKVSLLIINSNKLVYLLD